MLNTHWATVAHRALLAQRGAPEQPGEQQLALARPERPSRRPPRPSASTPPSPPRPASLPTPCRRCATETSGPTLSGAITTSGLWLRRQEPAGVEHPHLAEPAAAGEGGVEQVPFDRQQDRRADPVQHAGIAHSAVLPERVGPTIATDVTSPAAAAALARQPAPTATPPAAVWRPPLALRGHQPAAPRPTTNRPGTGAAHQQRAQLAAGGEPGVRVDPEPPPRRPQPPRHGHR